MALLSTNGPDRATSIYRQVLTFATLLRLNDQSVERELDYYWHGVYASPNPCKPQNAIWLYPSYGVGRVQGSGFH